MDEYSLAHTTWDCKYHIVFAPKYRRKEIYGKLKADIGKILRELCNWKGVEIIEAHACVDHIHMYVRIPQKTNLPASYFCEQLRFPCFRIGIMDKCYFILRHSLRHELIPDVLIYIECPVPFRC